MTTTLARPRELGQVAIQVIHRPSWRPTLARGASLASAVAFLCAATLDCSLVIDRDTTQCKTDGDCARFGNATCQSGVCVSTGSRGGGGAGSGGTKDVAGAGAGGTLLAYGGAGAGGGGAGQSDPKPSGAGAGGGDAGWSDALSIAKASDEDSGDPSPSGCFSGSPTTTLEYYNACTTAQSRTFDNCERLGVCGDAATLSDPVAPKTSVKLAATVNQVSAPTLKCSTAGANVIYMTGAADFGPLLAAVTPLLTANDPPYRVVFQNSSSCAGADAAFDTSKAVIQDVLGSATSSANYAYFYDDEGTAVRCLLDASGNTVDVGVSDLYSTVCDPKYVPGTRVAAYTGPVVTFGFVVPGASTQESISAEAAGLVFGRGGSNPSGKDASPWTNYEYLFVRNAGAASTALTAELIGVPRTQFWGVDALTTDNLRDSLEAVPETALESSIGVLSIDFAEKARGNLKTLYLQAPGQLRAFLPDSTPTGYDKLNVRDGHYPLWGYVHFYAPVTDGGVPSAAARAFLTRFSLPRLDPSLVDAIINASLVPQCAMKVKRSSEIGDLQANTGVFQCGCYFEKRTTGKTSCTSCTAAADCPESTPSCNYGYCETE